MRASSLLALATLLSPFAIVACAADAVSPAPTPVCDLDPETSVAPRRLAVNAGYMNAGYLNAGYLNAGYVNGIQVNGLQVNGIQINGTQINGIQINGIQINGVDAAVNELAGTTATGDTLHGDALVGATLEGILADGRTIPLVIDGFERAADIAYYRITAEGQNLCGPGGKGMFVPGAWDETAARHDRLEVAGRTITMSYACTDGVLAKCVTWGYAPWTVGAELHQTCTRMARADYCGRGVSFTKTGTAIDVFDAKGFQQPANEPGFAFEAAWGPNGAVCVARTRYESTTTDGTSVMPSCWSALPRCGSLEEGRALGATMGNLSKPQSRTLCGAGATP